VRATLIRSAALRAPQLGASLHLSAALAGDERPDGAWHAEWPVLRDLLRLALGTSDAASRLALGLRFEPVAIARNLGATGGLIVSERIVLALTPVLGPERVTAIVAAAGHS
ncbi:MAG TPA: adenylosuccinate lyase, partial [Terrimesophilobacter sp.]|nr:adenylosuccinate lyase [Terrimesophilobacter sp.]